jgi:hypothetical protein
VVWITLHGLRADAVGFLGGPRDLTPNLDRLASTATWAGRGVAASSATRPAVASLLTGLRPWQHQVLGPDSPPPAAHLATLPEALSARGYRTSAFLGSRWLRGQEGWLQGLARRRPSSRRHAPAEHLARAGAGDFVWVQLDRPSLPPRLHRRRLRRPPAAPEESAELWARYCLRVTAVDAELGRLLAALRAGRWDETLLVVVSDHGQHLGAGEGGALRREELEVPLVVKLPAAARAELAVGRDERVSLTRLWATVVELAGGAPPPATPPSLLRCAPGGALSELYLTDANHFSWVEGDLQLRRTVRLAGFSRDSLPWSAPFERTALELERWRVAGGSEPVDDAGAAARLEAGLAAAWWAFLDQERTPAGEAAARDLAPLGSQDG